MRILGIDPGFGRLGYGVIDAEPNGLRLVECGVIETDKRAAVANRLVEIREKIDALIRSTKPEAAAMERLVFAANRTTAMDVAKAAGVVMLTAADAGIEIVEYLPSEIKLTVSGNGAAHKSQIQFMVARLLKLQGGFRLDDEADALAAAICHAHSQRAATRGI